jgi:hypothetical protein
VALPISLGTIGCSIATRNKAAVKMLIKMSNARIIGSLSYFEDLLASFDWIVCLLRFIQK